jgi:HTH-type transcriptional regulator/antitoxin MqsA
MSTQATKLPKTMTSPETGETLTRGVRRFVVMDKGESVTVDLPGYYPEREGHGVHVGVEPGVVDAALAQLRRNVDSRPVERQDR